MRNQKICFILLLGMVILLSVQVVQAKEWQPYQFETNAYYEYRVSVVEGEDQKEFSYILDIKNGTKPDTCEISYTTREIKPKAELGPELLYDFWGGQGFSFAFIIMNPAFEFLFVELDLAVGEKMSFYGAGTMKVVNKEKVAGRDGFLCQYYQKGDEGDVLVAEWVIDPELALPLKSKMYEYGEVQYQVELVSYKKR